MQSATTDRYVQHLEEELYTTREALIKLAAPALSSRLFAFANNRDRDTAYRRFQECVDEILAAAEPFDAPTAWLNGVSSWPRAKCPLCGESARDRHMPNSGFAFPDGLRRHLTGEGNSIPCAVMHAARRLAHTGS